MQESMCFNLAKTWKNSLQMIEYFRFQKGLLNRLLYKMNREGFIYENVFLYFWTFSYICIIYVFYPICTTYVLSRHLHIFYSRHLYNICIIYVFHKQYRKGYPAAAGNTYTYRKIHVLYMYSTSSNKRDLRNTCILHI